MSSVSKGVLGGEQGRGLHRVVGSRKALTDEKVSAFPFFPYWGFTYFSRYFL
jgi:hypothetical protein